MDKKVALSIEGLKSDMVLLRQSRGLILMSVREVLLLYWGQMVQVKQQLCKQYPDLCQQMQER